MKFEPKTNSCFLLERHKEALKFLKLVSKENKLREIKNLDDVIDALDLTGHVEYLEGILKDHYINF